MKKEIKLVFRSQFTASFRKLYAYAFIAAYLAVFAYLMISYNLSYSNTNMSAVLSSMALAADVLIPSLALGTVRGKKEKTLSLISAMPLRPCSIEIGKLLANLAVLGIANIPVLVAPIVSGYFSIIDYTASYTLTVALLLFEIMLLCISHYVTLKIKNPVVAVSVNYVALTAVFLIGPASVLIPRSAIVSFIGTIVIAALLGLLTYAITKKKLASVIFGAVLAILLVPFFIIAQKGFEGLLRRIIEAVSVFKRFDVLTLGIFDLKTVLLFLLVSAAFVLLIIKNVSRITMRRASLKVASVAVPALLLISVVASVLPISIGMIDATGNGKYSIADSTKSFLSKLDETVTIYYLNPTSTEQSLTEFLKKYVSLSDDLKLVEVYPSTDADFFANKGIDPASIEAGTLLISSKLRSTVVYPSDMFTYSNEDLGFTNMDSNTYMQYLYYYYAYDSSSEVYDSLLYNTITCFNGDYTVTHAIEHVSRENMPTVFFLKGHGEADFSASVLNYLSQFEVADVYGFSLGEIELGEKVPEYAKAVFINSPTEDISLDEYVALSEYLASGGQITLLTDGGVDEFENLSKLLADYGMSESDQSLDIPEDASLAISSNHDITAMLVEITQNPVLLTDPVSIELDKEAQESLLLTSLVNYTDSDDNGETEDPVYALAAAAETANGARLVWISGAKDFGENASESCNAELLICAASWTTMLNESSLKTLTPIIYSYPTVEIDSAMATMFKLLFVALAILPVICGTVDVIKRKRTDMKNK